MDYRLNRLPTERSLFEGTDRKALDCPFEVFKNDGSIRVVRVRFVGSRPWFIGEDGKGEDIPDSKIEEAAKDLLSVRLNDRTCDPFSHPETDSILLLSTQILEHWRTERSIPPHL